MLPFVCKLNLYLQYTSDDDMGYPGWEGPGGRGLVDKPAHFRGSSHFALRSRSHESSQRSTDEAPPGTLPPPLATSHHSATICSTPCPFPSFLWESLSLLNIRLQDILLRCARQASQFHVQQLPRGNTRPLPWRGDEKLHTLPAAQPHIQRSPTVKSAFILN